MGFTKFSDINFFEQGRPRSEGIPLGLSLPPAPVDNSPLARINRDLADPILRQEELLQKRAIAFIGDDLSLEPDYDDDGLICRIDRLQ